MTYVIVAQDKRGPARYVAKTGNHATYTTLNSKSLAVFATREDAEKSGLCENEEVVFHDAGEWADAAQ